MKNSHATNNDIAKEVDNTTNIISQSVLMHHTPELNSIMFHFEPVVKKTLLQMGSLVHLTLVLLMTIYFLRITEMVT